MAALHCNRCELDWPVRYDRYRPCPECEGPTFWVAGGLPLDSADAHSRACHAEFERWLDEHGRRTPEELLEQAAALEAPVLGD